MTEALEAMERDAQRTPTRGDVNPAMLRLARGALGLTQKELADRLGVTQGKVSKWEDGLLSPSADEVARVASVVDRPAELFYQHDVVLGTDTSFLYHRRRKSVSVRVLNQLQDRINLIRIGVSRLLRNVEDVPVRFKRLDPDDYSGPEGIAEVVRAAWQVPRGPVADLTAVVESAGGIVIPMDFGTNLIDAAHLWPVGMPPLFFVNTTAPADRTRFSLAHEVGHAIMHEFPTPDLEDQADRFASEFMMPTREAAVELVGLTVDRAFRLKLRWRMSAQFLVRRARDAGTITDRRYRDLFAYMSRLGYRRAEPHPIQPEKPTTLARLSSLYQSQLGYRPDDLRAMTYATSEEARDTYHFDGPPGPLRVVG